MKRTLDISNDQLISMACNMAVHFTHFRADVHLRRSRCIAATALCRPRDSRPAAVHALAHARRVAALAQQRVQQRIPLGRKRAGPCSRLRTGRGWRMVRPVGLQRAIAARAGVGHRWTEGAGTWRARFMFRFRFSGVRPSGLRCERGRQDDDGGAPPEVGVQPLGRFQHVAPGAPAAVRGISISQKGRRVQ